MSDRPMTLGQLRASGWVSRSVKDEVRENAIAKIRAGEPMFEGVLGYEDTVLPQLENALLAGHDVIFLGERGQQYVAIAATVGLAAPISAWPATIGSAVRYAGKPLPFRQTALASFTGAFDWPQCRPGRAEQRRGALSLLFALGPECGRDRKDHPLLRRDRGAGLADAGCGRSVFSGQTMRPR